MSEKLGYRIDELAKDGPLRRSALYEAIARGHLIARKHGRVTIVLKADYEDFLRRLPPMYAAPGGR
jgi:hypothetical protein